MLSRRNVIAASLAATMPPAAVRAEAGKPFVVMTSYYG